MYRSRLVRLIVMIVLPLLLLYVVIFYDHSTQIIRTLRRETNTSLLLQLKESSMRLNLRQEREQQLNCEMKSQKVATDTGGWCNHAIRREHRTDKALARALATLFAGCSVVGLGDGGGVYRRRILKTGKVKKYDAYDGSPYIYNISRGEVKFIDLTLPQYWLPRYDWVMCLEVIEHIPAHYETIVLDNIDRAAGHGVVLSWATPRQKGFRHVNCRPPDYVNKTMSDRGLIVDQKASDFLRQSAWFSWLKSNILVFVRQ